MDSSNTQFVWIFNGSRFPSGVFRTRDLGEAWITKRRLSGVLTKYPVDSRAYDWSIETGIFRVQKEEHPTPEFIAGFGCAAFEHYHYENGELS
jgi:hypothetical protein